MLFIIFVIIYLLNFYFQFFKSPVAKLFVAIISLFIFYLALLGVKETADSNAYIFFFENQEVKTDFMFRFLSNFFANIGLDYFYLYQFHVLLFGILFAFFVSRFTNNIFLILIFYLLLLYVPLANQIRYYLGFGFFLNAIYFFYLTKKKFTSYLFIIISILSHSSIILLYGFILLNKFSTKENFLERCFYLSAIVFVLVFSLNTIGLNSYLGSYNDYFNIEVISSLSGGLYNIFPYIILLLLLHYRYKNSIKKYDQFNNDICFQLLYKLSFYPLIFIPASLYIQILAHRFVHASLIIWLCFYCYSLIYEKSFKVYFNHVISICFVMTCLFYYTYFFSEIFFNEKTSYVIEFEKSFNSIEYLPNIEL